MNFAGFSVIKQKKILENIEFYTNTKKYLRKLKKKKKHKHTNTNEFY